MGSFASFASGITSVSGAAELSSGLISETVPVGSSCSHTFSVSRARSSFSSSAESMMISGINSSEALSAPSDEDAGVSSSGSVFASLGCVLIRNSLRSTVSIFSSSASFAASIAASSSAFSSASRYVSMSLRERTELLSSGSSSSCSSSESRAGITSFQLSSAEESNENAGSTAISPIVLTASAL